MHANDRVTFSARKAPTGVPLTSLADRRRPGGIGGFFSYMGFLPTKSKVWDICLPSSFPKLADEFAEKGNEENISHLRAKGKSSTSKVPNRMGYVSLLGGFYRGYSWKNGALYC